MPGSWRYFWSVSVSIGQQIVVSSMSNAVHILPCASLIPVSVSIGQQIVVSSMSNAVHILPCVSLCPVSFSVGQQIVVSSPSNAVHILPCVSLCPVSFSVGQQIVVSSPSNAVHILLCPSLCISFREKNKRCAEQAASLVFLRTLQIPDGCTDPDGSWRAVKICLRSPWLSVHFGISRILDW